MDNFHAVFRAPFPYTSEIWKRASDNHLFLLHNMCFRCHVGADGLPVDRRVPAPSMTEGLLVLVQLVMAAMTTDP